VSDQQPVPTDPAAVKAWVASLSREDLAALTQQVLGGGLGALLGVDEYNTGNRPIQLPDPPEQVSALTVTVELRGSKPRIWRRLRLPGDVTLEVVHLVLQAAMGWSDSHPHRFQPGGARGYTGPYFITAFDEEEEGDEGTREEAVRLDQVLREPGDRLTYLYDFGDGWEHLITLESVAPMTAEDRDPVCLGGARACPPEDVGGIHSHIELAAWLRAGAPADQVPEPFDDAEHAHGWLPVGYDPDAFDPAETTAAIRTWIRGEHVPWHGVPEPLAELVRGIRGPTWMQATDWLNTLGAREPVTLIDADLHLAARPWRAVLDAVGDGIRLTSAGYLPPAVVEQIAETSGITTWWIGKANREDLTYPVAFLRENSQALGLLRKSRGVLAPTARAKATAGDPHRLVTAVLDRFPVGKGFDAEAGWLLLLAAAAGAADNAEVYTHIAQMLTDRGWRTRPGSDVTTAQARHGARATLDALESMAGDHNDTDTALLTRLARAALLGTAPNT